MTRGIHRAAPSLREVQRNLAAGVLAGRLVGGPLAAWLAVPPGVIPAARLAVYVDGYPSRLHDALAEQFPALAHLVGAQRFHALGHRYQRGARLRSYNLNCTGAELPDFLRDDALAADLPFTPDLAALEWAVNRAFHAHDVVPLDPSQLSTWSSEDFARLRLRFQPSLAVLESRWPIRTLWEARATPREQIDIDLGVAESVLVRRDGLYVVCDALEASEATVLRRLLGGTSLGTAATDLAAAGVAAEQVTDWFGRWMARGMIAA